MDEILTVEMAEKHFGVTWPVIMVWRRYVELLS